MVPPLTLCAYMKKGPNLRWSLIQCSGGDEGNRTPDLLTASQALSQLSYAPVRRSTIRELPRRCKDNFGKTFAGPGEAGPARGAPGLPGARAPADLTRRTRLAPCNRVFRTPPVPLSGPIAKHPPLRFRTMPVYYDESGMSDHTRLLTQPAGSLPAVLQLENTRCSGVADPS